MSIAHQCSCSIGEFIWAKRTSWHLGLGLQICQSIGINSLSDHHTQLHEQIAETHSQLSDIYIYQLRYLHAYSLAYDNSKFMRMEKNSTASLSSMEHDHCVNCFSRYCDILPNNCPQIQCPNCSARLHNCKLDDHLEICTRVGILCHSFKSSGFLTNKQLWWEVAAFVIFTILPYLLFYPIFYPILPILRRRVPNPPPIGGDYAIRSQIAVDYAKILGWDIKKWPWK